MLGNRSDNARLQSDFYRDQYRKMLRWLIVAIVVMLLLISAIIYKVVVRPAQQYYANTSDGKIIVMPIPSQG